MRKIFLAALALSGFFYSCHTSKNTNSDVVIMVSDSTFIKDSLAKANYVSDTIIDKTFRRPIRDKELFIAVKDLITLDTAYINGDTLHLLTPKLTGCEAEKFNLVWNGMMLKSWPPQTNVKLLQTADANCKKTKAFHLSYNITPLRFKEDSTAAGDHRTTMVRVIGWKELLRYEFIIKGAVKDTTQQK